MSMRAVSPARAVALIVSGCLACAAFAQDPAAAAGLNSPYEYHWQWSVPSHAGISYEGFRSFGGDGSVARRDGRRVPGGERRRVDRRIERLRERERLGTGGLSCTVFGGWFDEGTCFGYVPGFGTQRQPMPLLP
jgi:hypothetical protein